MITPVYSFQMRYLGPKYILSFISKAWRNVITAGKNYRRHLPVYLSRDFSNEISASSFHLI